MATWPSRLVTCHSLGLGQSLLQFGPVSPRDCHPYVPCGFWFQAENCLLCDILKPCGYVINSIYEQSYTRRLHDSSRLCRIIFVSNHSHAVTWECGTWLCSQESPLGIQYRLYECAVTCGLCGNNNKKIANFGERFIPRNPTLLHLWTQLSLDTVKECVNSSNVCAH